MPIRHSGASEKYIADSLGERPNRRRKFRSVPAFSNLAPFRQTLQKRITERPHVQLEPLAKRGSHCPARLARRRNVREPSQRSRPPPFRQTPSDVSRSKRQSTYSCAPLPQMTKRFTLRQPPTDHSGGSNGASLKARPATSARRRKRRSLIFPRHL